MKKFLTSPGLLALGLAFAGVGAAHAQAPTVDGTRGTTEGYGTAIGVQTVETSYGDATTTSTSAANGSELDNIHARIVGSDLYLFIGGNLENNNNGLLLFFDSKSGGQSSLTNNSNNFLGNYNGLTFDTGMAPDFAIDLNRDSSTPANFYVNYSDIPSAGSSNSNAYLGNVPGTSRTLPFSQSVASAADGDVAIDNSNTAGVGGNFNMAANATAAAVATGLEFRIPLSALGTTVNGGNIRITALVRGGNSLSNQVLGGLPVGTSYPGNLSSINFNSFAGNQYVTVTNGGAFSAPGISATPGSLAFGNVAAGSTPTRTFSISNTGGGTLNVTGITSTNAAYTVSPTTASLTAGMSAVITVTFNGATGSQTGTINIASNAGAASVSVSGTGVAAGQVVLDGTVDAALYGPAKALQTSATGFSDGQELDGAYTRVTSTDLYVTLTGNLPPNSNKVVVFFDANPATGQNTIAGNNPTVDFGNSGNLAGLLFDRGFAPESFISLNTDGSSLYANYVLLNSGGGNGTYLSTTGNGFTQTLTFAGGATGELSLNNANTAGVDGSNVNNPGAVTTGIEFRIPLSVLGGTVTSTTPLHIMAILLNDTYTYASNQTLGGLPFGTGNLGANGSGGGSVPYTVDFLNYLGNQFFTAQRGDVTISSATDLAGDYRNVTITAAGNVSVNSPLDVSGTLNDQGTLQFQAPADALVRGAGATVVGTNGATPVGNLVISSSAGITAAGGTGNVQTATRTFGSSAQYAYGNLTGAAMNTGSGLPATVFGLAVGTAASLSLTQAVAVSGTVALTSTGNLLTNGKVLTLLSSASGSALVANVGTGTVQGAATVQRYIDRSLYAGQGYHHFAPPVSNTNITDLATGSFAPVVNTALNTATNPRTVSPFPNVQRYDESRVLTSPATTISAFDKGFFSPASLTEGLAVGEGYSVNIGSLTPVDFVGTLNNGDITRTLPRTGGVDGGWNFVGNPYPAPLNYALVVPGDRTGLDAPIYVWQATSLYGGMYRSYLPGAPGTGDPILASSQGFWTRTTSAGTPGSLAFHNRQRVLTAATASALQRGPADTRPVLVMALATAGLPADVLTVYADARATAGLDAQYDAVKLHNPNGLNLAAQTAGLLLAYDARPVLTAATIIPLDVRVPAAGSYTLTATMLRHLPAGLTAHLVDALTGQRVALNEATRYTFSLTAAQAAAPGTGRFSLEFAGAALATAATLEGAGITLYPNPAHATATLLVPAMPGASQVEIGLYNGLGQLVRQFPATTLPVAGLRAELSLEGVASGLYTVRLTAGGSTISKKLAVE